MQKEYFNVLILGQTLGVSSKCKVIDDCAT